MPIIGVIDSSKSGNLYAASFESIQTITVGAGGASSVSFTSIPQTYTHLQVRFIGRWTAAGTGEGAGRILINGSALDRSHYIVGDGSTSGSASPGPFYTSFPNAGQNGFNAGVLDILDYTSTNKTKTLKTISGYDNNGAGVSLFLLYGGLENTLSAITSLTFDSSTALTFGQHSQFALYGIKGV